MLVGSQEDWIRIPQNNDNDHTMQVEDQIFNLGRPRSNFGVKCPSLCRPWFVPVSIQTCFMASTRLLSVCACAMRVSA